MNADILSQCSLFASIAAEDIAPLCRRIGAYTRRYRAGQSVWLTGDPVLAAGLILSGSVRAEALSPDGTRDVAAQQGAGGLVGDVLMTEGRASPVDVLAAEDGTELLFLPFDPIMDGGGDPALSRLRRNLLQEISSKYWLLRRRIVCLRAPDLRGKLLTYLSHCAADAGADTFLVPLDRQGMADYLAANRSALCRELSAMRRDGLIDYYGASFRLLPASRSCNAGGIVVK